MAKKKKKKKKTNVELYKTIRKDWGDFNPISRVVESKKKYNRKKNSNKVKSEDY